MATSNMRQPKKDSAWSLGAVRAEREVDDRTWLVVVRADAGLGAALALGQRLLGLRLAGYTTVVVDLGKGEHVTGAVLAVLLQSRRKLELRDGRLAVVAESPGVRSTLARAGLEVADPWMHPLPLAAEGRDDAHA
jgi:anti-anti-sigma regulatory factor